MSHQELNEVVWRWISDSQSAKPILVACFVGLAIVWQFFRYQSGVRTKQRLQAAADAYAEREYSQYEFSTSLYE